MQIKAMIVAIQGAIARGQLSPAFPIEAEKVMEIFLRYLEDANGEDDWNFKKQQSLE